MPRIAQRVRSIAASAGLTSQEQRERLEISRLDLVDLERARQRRSERQAAAAAVRRFTRRRFGR